MEFTWAGTAVSFLRVDPHLKCDDASLGRVHFVAWLIIAAFTLGFPASVLLYSRLKILQCHDVVVPAMVPAAAKALSMVDTSVDDSTEPECGSRLLKLP